MATIAVQLIDCQRREHLETLLSVMDTLGMDDPSHPIKISVGGTIEAVSSVEYVAEALEPVGQA